MKRLFFAFLIVFVLSESLYAQTEKNGKIVAFHPSAGNSLDLSEKKKYAIFTEYNDSLFESAQLIKYSSDSYSVLIKTVNGKSFEKPAAIRELDSIYAAIEKVKPTAFANAITETENKLTAEEKRKRERRAEIADTLAQISYQSFIIILDIIWILANN